MITRNMSGNIKEKIWECSDIADGIINTVQKECGRQWVRIIKERGNTKYNDRKLGKVTGEK